MDTTKVSNLFNLIKNCLSYSFTYYFKRVLDCLSLIWYLHAIHMLVLPQMKELFRGVFPH